MQRALVAALGMVTAGVLFALMALTCTDVAGRYLFNAPVQGGLEITQLLLAATIFCALPLVTLGQQHVTADLFDAVSPGWMLRAQHVAACAVGAAALAVLAWRLWLHGAKLMQAGEVTSVLRLKLAPFAYGMSVLMWLNVAILLFLLSRKPQRQAPPPA